MKLKSLGIYRRGNVFWMAWTVAGKRYRQSLQTSDEQTAIARALDWRSRPQLIVARQLEREIDAYVAECLAKGKHRAVTAQGRKCGLHAFRRATGAAAVSDLTPGLIRKWYDERRAVVSVGSADLYLKFVRAFCRWLVANNKIRISPAADIRPAFQLAPARTEFCDAATVDRLIAAAPDDWFRFVLLAGFDAGMRRNEIVQARRHWFNLDAGSIHVADTPTFRTKSGRPRTIPLTSRFLAFMREKHADTPGDAFILDPQITEWTNVQFRVEVTVRFKEFTTAQGVPWVHTHTMRRTFASLRVSAGVSIYKVAGWLGDRFATVERHYARLSPVDEEIERVHRANGGCAP